MGLPGSGPAAEQVLLAYDGMSLPLSLLTASPRVMRPLKIAFSKEDKRRALQQEDGMSEVQTHADTGTAVPLHKKFAD